MLDTSTKELSSSEKNDIKDKVEEIDNIDTKKIMAKNLIRDNIQRLSDLRGKSARGTYMSEDERTDLIELENEQVTRHQAKV
jgi:hypothetical protein